MPLRAMTATTQNSDRFRTGRAGKVKSCSPLASRAKRYTIYPAALFMIACGGLRLAGQQSTVKRGEPQREGGAWVEHADCSVPVRDGQRLILRTDFGSITVHTGQNGRMNCQVRLQAYTRDSGEARRYFRTFELVLHESGANIYLNGRSAYERHHAADLNAEFYIQVPQRFNLDLQTQGGDIGIERLDGEFRASTAGGDIRAGDINGPVKVQTAGGNITLGTVGQRLEASTAGGNIRVGDVKGNVNLDTSGGEIVAGLIQGSITAQTAGGDIVLRGASGPVAAETAGGQIQIGDCGSTVRAETAGGNIRLQGARGVVHVQTAAGSIDLFQLQSSVRAATAAGRILAEINASPRTFANSNLETSVGDVQVFLPGNLPLNISAIIEQAAGHKISSDFPLTLQGQPPEEDQDFGPRTVRGQGALNGGGKDLVIRTVMGNIEIHKLDSALLNQLRTRQEMYWSNWQSREGKRIEQELRKVQRRVQQQLEREQQQLQRQQQELQKELQQDDDED